MRVIVPADGSQPVFDIGAGLGLRQRAEMIGGEHALSELFEVLAAEHGAELRLAEQDGLHAGASVDGDVRQHPQLFQRAERQILHLVDH